MAEECRAPAGSTQEEEEGNDIESRNIELDFGTVEVFKERTKFITFYRPKTDENITYNIKKNHVIKSIKPNFELEHYEGALKPDQDFKIAVTYKPTLASVKDVEVFDYTASDCELIKITLTGIAIGPHCLFSAKALQFYRTPEKTLLERKVEMKNDSAAAARFKIELANKDVFRIEPLEGTVKPNSYQYITVRFCPRKPGIFARKVACLIWNSVFHISPKFMKCCNNIRCNSIGQYLDVKHYTSGSQDVTQTKLDDFEVREVKVWEEGQFNAMQELVTYFVISESQERDDFELLIYRKQLHQSDPLMLNIFGVYSTKVAIVDSGLKHFMNVQTFGFKAYLYDNVPFSLVPQYLDFGSVLMNGQQPKTQLTNMTNNWRSPIFVDWDQGNVSKVFEISPKSVTIPPQASVQFEVEFEPDENYNVFHEILVAQVEWDPDTANNPNSELLPLPLTCTLRAQGHSFRENEGWIANIEVLPEVIYWQPCSPGEVASTTFSMRNKSHLPVLYRLVSPKKSNVIAKPMMGKFRKVEIIAIQLQTEAIKIKTYIEEWKIIVNGREDRQITIYLHGETCVPTVEIGKGNKVNAGSIQEGSQKEIEVTMKNTSYFAIWYKFQLVKNSIVGISPMSGRLLANEWTKLQMKVTGSQCAPSRETLLCQINIIDGNGAISGASHEVEVDIYTESSYSELCACPSSENLGRLPFGCRIKAKFKAVNFGDATIYFQACQLGEEQMIHSFRIKPSFGEIKPKDSKQFSIIGIISRVGNQILQFGYYNRMMKDSPLVTGDPIILFRLTCCAEFPVIQVEEIVEDNFGELFGKLDFYQHYLEIPKLNKILHEILNDETKQLHLRLPEQELQKKEFYVKLALTNITDFNTTIVVKRKKLCNCALEEMSTGISGRKKGYNCPHRESLNIELEENTFLAKTTRFLIIKAVYCLEEEIQMCFLLQLSDNRVVELFFKIYSIPPETPRLSIYEKEFALELKPVYLGTQVAPVQMFWMYNNTKHLLNYEFDTAEVKRMCRIDGFTVLEILNPVDQIMPYYRKALLVRFHPIEEKTYSIEIDVNYSFSGDNQIWSKFLIRGEGTFFLENNVDKTTGFPRVARFRGELPISLSLEYLEIKKLPVWSRRKELIFIENISSGKIIQFVWGTVKIDNVIEISTETNFSIIQPENVQPIMITIKSYSEPCTGIFILPCEVVYYSDEVAHQITTEKYQIAESRIDEYMKDEPVGTKRPTNPINVVPKPETLFASVAINITTIHTKDIDENMDISLQIRQYPNQSLENVPKSLLKKYHPDGKVRSYPEKGKIGPTLTANEKEIFCRVLENVLSDVLFSDILKGLLEQSTKAPAHKYNEFLMDEGETITMFKSPVCNGDIAEYRKREIEYFFQQMKITDMSNILQTLIYESVLASGFYLERKYSRSDLNKKIVKSLHTCTSNSCSCNKDIDSQT